MSAAHWIPNLPFIPVKSQRPSMSQSPNNPKKPNDWREGILDVPLHLATWGVVGFAAMFIARFIAPGFLLTILLTGVAGASCFEAADVIADEDTIGKAAIDATAKSFGFVIGYVLFAIVFRV